MAIRMQIPAGATPIAAVDVLMQLCGRNEIERAIEALIEHLDALDGDADLEPNGDLADGTLAEDEWRGFSPTLSQAWAGPGCPISDAPEPDGDEQDHGGAEDDFCAHRPDGPGCPIADSDAASWVERAAGGITLQTHGEEDDEPDHPEVRRRHTSYIRADLRRRGRA